MGNGIDQIYPSYQDNLTGYLGLPNDPQVIDTALNLRSGWTSNGIVVIDASVQWSDVLSYPNDPFIV